ncbi:MAG TPA: UDP-N-acetylmuramate dehydrogenase [Burkholderiaceae bacterium]|jgi:UDP-N-acetylmuramate dehydrogenase
MNPSLPILHNVSLRGNNTFGIEAAAQAYLALTDLAQLPLLSVDKTLAAMPRLVLGGGSNILLTADFPGLVLHVELRGIETLGEHAGTQRIRVAGGENWHRFVLWTLEQGYGGLENLSLIPGSVGAAPIQNIGAYGVEVGEFIESVTYFDFAGGGFFDLSREECTFGYRDSVFKHRLRDSTVIVAVTFALPLQWQANTRYVELAQELAARAIAEPTPSQISEAVIAIRRRKLPDPAQIGNAGSFFKNPLVPAAQRDALQKAHPQLVSYAQPDGSYKLAAGWLIDQCGWKGRSIGAAGVYEKQALVLVNRGGANGADIWRLAQAVQADVRARFGVILEAEPIVI